MIRAGPYPEKKAHSARIRPGQAPTACLPGCGRKGGFFSGAFPARPHEEFSDEDPQADAMKAIHLIYAVDE